MTGEPKMKKTITLLLSSLLCLQAFAETQPIIQQGTGIAPTREEAIKKAIFEAVAKAKGISVGSGEYNFQFKSASADIDTVPGNRRPPRDGTPITPAGQ